eukprot:847294_1
MLDVSMNRCCYTTTLMERTHFNGFFSFDAYCKNLVAKQFSRFIRNNNQNGLSRIKSAKIREIKEWKNKTIMTVPKLRKNDIVWQSFMTSNELGTDDSVFFAYPGLVNRSAYNYIPSDIPKCFTFIPYDSEWNDEQMEENVYYIALDGSVLYKSADEDGYVDPRSTIVGTGGSAIAVYTFDGVNTIKHTECPNSLTCRTHINVMELQILYIAIQWIVAHVQQLQDVSIIKRYHIISDSQNCLNIISQRNGTQDDALMSMYSLIDKEMQKLQDNHIPIHMQWVPSHVGNSVMNEEVDVLARDAAQSVYTQMDEMNSISDGMYLCPNEYVAFQTVKSEVRWRAICYDASLWDAFKLNHKDDYLCHYFNWSIQWDPKKHSDLVEFLSSMENDIRVLLMTNQIPFNDYMARKAKHPDYSPHCEHYECQMDYKIETMHHGILSCPNERYTEDRQTMIDTVKSAFLLHLDDIEQMPDTDPKDLYLKQFIYPSYQLSKKRRLDIFRAVMFYLINARPEIIERIKINCVRSMYLVPHSRSDASHIYD